MDAASVNPASNRATKLEQFRKEADFLKRLLSTANSVDSYVAAARAAAKLAVRATKDLQAAEAANEAVITVRNVPREWSWVRIKELLDKLEVKVVRVDKGPDWDKAILTISDVADQGRFIAALTGVDVEGMKLQAVAGAPSALEMSELRLLAHKSKRALEAAAGVAAKMQRSHLRAQVLGGACPPPSDICSVVCPWSGRPYAEQLSAKREKLQELMSAVSEEVASRCGEAPSSWPVWLQQQPKSAQGSWQPCAEVVGVVRSPAIAGYRNKSDLPVGLDVSEKRVEVGFYLGSTADGITAVADPEPTLHTSSTAKAYAHILRDFINQSNLPAWDKRMVPSNGFWRLVVVREARKVTPVLGDEAQRLADLDLTSYMAAAGREQEVAEASATELPPPDEVAVIVQVNHEFTDATVMKAELQALAEHVRQQASSQGLPLTYLLAQCHSALGHTPPPDAPVLPLLPESSGGSAVPDRPILDALCELRFRIHPFSFFQVNTAAACLLCKLVGDWASEGLQPDNTLLLDVCCGTGLFGLTLASMFSRVVCIDSSEIMLETARDTAALNSIDNAEFMVGKAEQVLPEVLALHAEAHDAVVAVLDPPRTGLSPTAIQQLLTNSKVQRIVYVSCSLETLAANLADFCGAPRTAKGSQQRRNKKTHLAPSQGPYFRPRKAAGVDLFPHTAQFHAVVVLDRVQ